MIRRLLLAALVALVSVGCIPAGARGVIGDSLSVQARPHLAVDHVDAVKGRALRDSGGLIVGSAQAECVVVALGSNDVATSTRAQMAADVAATAEALSSTPCAVFTTVTLGTPATTFYHPQWAERAAYWNSLVAATGRPVADWAAASEGHPEWFQADGLHLTPAGRQAYAMVILDAMG